LAIPGLKPTFDVRAKVRIGEKKRSAKGNEFPAALDYFKCDDAEFDVLAGDKPKELRIILPFAAPADNFGTGLEFWRGKQLTCYSKGEGTPPLAYRVNSMMTADVEKRGEPMGRGKERTPITCTFRECPIFKKKDCRPMGRLQFFLAGGRTDSVLQLETKSWNTIEGVEATLASASAKGDLRGRVFLLSVAIEQKANQKFPVVSLKEADVMPVNSESDAEIADALLPLASWLDAWRTPADDGTSASSSPRLSTPPTPAGATTPTSPPASRRSASAPPPKASSRSTGW
jgi:hypothetical protein